ncbi:VanZ family protein [Streptomyces durbertensis]|uniref:VanZ family protein n=1 Tax=Streptomyces durbertensis TaxID=2448886 RepID=A0ABR6EKI8_9ACTN|nr:VanZ family protein [Streptomyces durbertensis]MBB1245845.1 VanZ family protein [Streptomyces durbertensis]
MLSAIFQGQTAFIVLATLAVLAAASATFVFSRTTRGRRLAWAGLAASVTAELALTIFLPGEGGGGSSTPVCVVNHDLVEPFATTQGLLNLLMFLPIGACAALALRSLVPAALGGALLSVATELTQAVAPFVHRGCDTSDLVMNSLGAALGALGGLAVLKARGLEVRPVHAHARPTFLAAGALVLLAGALVGGRVLTLQHVDSSSLRFAGSDAEKAANAAIQEAFGDRYSISAVQVQAGIDGFEDRLLITLDEGTAELTWPTARQLSVSLENSSETTSTSFSIPGVTKKPTDEKDAVAIARIYVKAHYPWALRASGVSSYAVGEQAELGWVVSWQRRDRDGVRMPTRLDVQINTAGRVSQLLVDRSPDPQNMARPVLKERDAEKAGRKLLARDAELGSERLTLIQAELIAVRTARLPGGEGKEGYRPQWLLSFSTEQGEVLPERILVDAVTGKAVDRASAVDELEQSEGEMGALPPEDIGS